MAKAKPELLAGLATGDELKPIYALRSKKYDEKTISAGSKPALASKLDGEEQDGWRVLRRNKKSLRLAKNKPADRQLEDDVWSVLYRMGFKEMSRDRQFLLSVADGTNPRQLDVFAKDDEAVLIVECTHSKDSGPKSVHSLLDKIEAIRQPVINLVHSHYGKSPRLKVKFAIATSVMDWRPADRDRADKAGIAVITEGDLAYFSKLTDILKGAARYQFLGRYFAGEKVEGLRTRVPATRGRAGGAVFYNFLISPHELLRQAYISHKSKTSNDDLETYQRMVKPARLKSIGAYIDGGGKFPTNIVVNFKLDGSMNFEHRETFGETATGILTLPGQYGSAWVIDGQHRLYGYAYAGRSEEDDHSVVSVLAYENMPMKDEIKLFVDINTEQVKVKGNLVHEIMASLDLDDPNPGRALEALQARIALRLDDDARSPTMGRVVTVSQDKTSHRCLTLTSLVDGMIEADLLGTVQRVVKGAPPSLQPGPLSGATHTATIEKTVATLSKFLGLFALPLSIHWDLGDAKGGYLCTNNGVRALMLLLGRLIRFVEAQEGVKASLLDPDDIVAYVEPYARHVVDYFASADAAAIVAFRTRGSSLVGVEKNCLQMMSIIYEADPTFRVAEVVEYMESRDVEGTREARDLIDEINRILHNDVLGTLKEKYGSIKDAWWMKGVPPSIRNECDRLFNMSEGDRDRWQFLFLSNYQEIVVYGDNWDLFKDYYNFYGTGKKADLVRWIGRVNKARTVTHHAEKGPLPREEVAYVRHVHGLVKEHIEGREKVDGKKSLMPELAAVPVAAPEAA